MKRAGADIGFLFLSTPEIMNPGVEPGKVVILKTVPVGAPLLPKRSTGVGMLTTRGLMVTELGALAPGGIVRNPEGRAGWSFGDTPRIQQIWINRTSVGNAILVDQRRFVDDKVRCLVTAGFDCGGCPKVRNEYSEQHGRQCRTAHSSLPRRMNCL